MNCDGGRQRRSRQVARRRPRQAASPANWIRSSKRNTDQMSKPTTLATLLQAGDAKAAAIGAPDRATMTRAELTQLVDQVGGALRGMGIQAEDKVAIVMPNGPEMAAAFVAVACWSCAAPLNPSYRADEFDFYLGDIDAKALIIQAGPDAPARAVAAQRKIPVIDLTPQEDKPAGSFTL